MKKIFLLEDLDCAHCAALIEGDVAKLEGVNSCSVTLLTQKITLDIIEEKASVILKDIKKIVKKYEPDVTVIEK